MGRPSLDGGGSRRRWTVGGWVALWLLGTVLAAKEVPYLSGRLNDLAAMVPGDAAGRIESALARLEHETGAQMAILTVDSLEGEALEEYALRVAETWALGGQERDDGVLLLIARQERKMRLEVGYGLEPTLTDAMSRRILDGVLQPAFRRGDFGGGVERAVGAVSAVLAGGEISVEPVSEGTARRGARAAGNLARVLFFAFVALVFVLGLGRRRRRYRGGFGGGFYTGGFGGGSTFGGGGFSGGGGSFGGGGASSRW